MLSLNKHNFVSFFERGRKQICFRRTLRKFILSLDLAQIFVEMSVSSYNPVSIQQVQHISLPTGHRELDTGAGSYGEGTQFLYKTRWLQLSRHATVNMLTKGISIRTAKCCLTAFTNTCQLRSIKPDEIQDRFKVFGYFLCWPDHKSAICLSSSKAPRLARKADLWKWAKFKLFFNSSFFHFFATHVLLSLWVWLKAVPLVTAPCCDNKAQTKCSSYHLMIPVTNKRTNMLRLPCLTSNWALNDFFFLG